jgi:hypothetical protein
MTKLEPNKISLSMSLPDECEWEETVMEDNRMVYDERAVGWDEKVKFRGAPI